MRPLMTGVNIVPPLSIWVHAETREGRRVKLDHLNRVIWNIPAAVKTECFNDATLVIPDTSADMLKAKSSGRGDMPSWALTIRTFVEANAFGGPHFPCGHMCTADTKCVTCKAASEYAWPDSNKELARAAIGEMANADVSH